MTIDELVKTRLHDDLTDNESFVSQDEETVEPEVGSIKNQTTEHKNNGFVWQKVKRSIGKAALLGSLVVPGAALGSITAVSETPPTIKLAPGITAKASPMLGDYSAIKYGPTEIGFPELHGKIGGTSVGAKLNVTGLDTKGGGRQEQTFRAILQNPGGIIQSSEVEKAIKWRAQEGGAIGGTIGALGFFGISEILRRRKKTRASEVERHQRLQEHVDNPSENISVATLTQDEQELEDLDKKLKPGYHKLRKRIGAVAASVVLLASSSLLAKHSLDNLRPTKTSKTSLFTASNNQYINEALSDNSGFREIFVTGDMGYLVKQGINKASDQMRDVDKYWSTQAEQVNSLLPVEFKNTRNTEALASNDAVTFVQITDIHDNRSYLKNFLPSVFNEIKPDFVLNIGDEMNYSGKVMLDEDAWQRVADTLPNDTPMVLIGGNHDPFNLSQAHRTTVKNSKGKIWRPIIPLDRINNYSTDIDGVTLVGSPDINRTTDKGTTPRNYEKQMANNARQGKLVAKKACDIYNKTGEKPIVATHEPEATYQAIVEGCAKLTLSGHLHKTYPVDAYKNSDGSITMQQTLGSASGDGPNNILSIFNKPTINADISIWQYNKVTGEMKELLISVKPHGKPVVKEVTLPPDNIAIAWQDNPKISDFIYGD